MKIRLFLISVGIVTTIAGCGGDAPTTSSYAEEVEELVAAMEVQFDVLDAGWESQPPSVAGAADYWEGRLRIRNEFLESLRLLEFPDNVAGMHQEALDVFTRITEADIALRDRVATFDSITDHWQWVDTPEGRAADAVLEDVYAFCRSSQEEFDATKERVGLDEAAWLPAEMREVVRVAFGCPPQDG